ncbi:hypothetical protein ACQKP3_15410 [Vibrio sp. DNB22_10_4]
MNQSHDKDLILELLIAGVDVITVAEKFDIKESELLKTVCDVDFELTCGQIRYRTLNNTLKFEEYDIVKKCCRCHQFLPLKDAFWYSSYTSGLKQPLGHCRFCENSRQIEKKQRLRSTNLTD